MADGLYYFTEDDYPSSVAGQLVTNKRITIDVDGDDETFYFDKTGKAYTMRVISGYIYGEDGKLITNYGDGNTYQKVKLGDLSKASTIIFTDKSGKTEITGSASDEILINENGKVKKSGKAKDVNEEDVHVSNYIVQPKK